MEKVQLVFENLKANDLYKTLKPEDIVLKETEFELDFSELDRRQEDIFNTSGFKRDLIDSTIGQGLYSAIANLPSEILSNERFWQWLSLVRYRKLTEFRLSKPISETPSQNLLSGKSLNHQNRHIFQRIYNILKIAYPDAKISDNFKLGKQLLQNQDAMTSICDRELGLNDKFIRKHLEAISLLGSTETQQFVKKLNAQSQIFLTDYL